MAEDSTKPVIDYEKLQKRPKRRVRTLDFKSVYSSSTELESSFHDIKLFFGEITVATHEELVIEEAVAIIMTPEHARNTAIALMRAVATYEQVFGPIRHIPGEAELDESKDTQPSRT